MWSWWKKISNRENKEKPFLLTLLKDQTFEIEELESKRTSLLNDWSKQLSEAKDSLS